MKKYLRSIEAKIAIIIGLAAAIFFLLMYSVCSYLAEQNFDQAFRSVGYVGAYYTKYMVEDVCKREGVRIEDLTDPEKSTKALQEIGEYSQKICQNLGIMHINLCMPTEDPDKGYCFLHVSKKEVLLFNDTNNNGGYYDMYPVSKDIRDGKVKDTVECHESRDGHVELFLTAIRDGQGKLQYIFDMNIDSSEMHSRTKKTMQRIYISISLLFLFVLSLLHLLIRRFLVGRIQVINFGMQNFVQNSNLSTERLKISGNDEIADMARSFNFMADNVRDYVEKNQKYEKERQQALAEIQIAAQIQTGLLPETEYQDEVLQIQGFIKPARNVGGDFYIYEKLDDARIGFAIGDVSGKGISASLMMSSTITAMRMAFRHGMSPAEVLNEVNRLLANNNPEMMFVTVFAAVFDAKAGELIYANAGHNPPYLIGKQLQKLDDNKGLMVGAFEDAEYTDSRIRPEPGSEVFLYTDGVNEAIDPNKEFFGVQRLESCLSENRTDRLEKVLSALQAFTDGEVQNDDITMMTVHFQNKLMKMLPAELSSLKVLRDFLLNNPFVPDAMRKKLYLAAEEIFVNICRYAYPDERKGTVGIEILAETDQITMILQDDGIPYDPLEKVREVEDYDPDVEIGGLGKYLAFTIMDETEYAYRDGKNIITMRKKYEQA